MQKYYQVFPCAFHSIFPNVNVLCNHNYQNLEMESDASL